MATHVVQPGDTLYSIARRNGTDVATLAAVNGLTDPSHIRIGQVLTVGGDPDPDLERQRLAAARRYTVVGGDTLSSIARRFGVTAQAISAANNLADPDVIRVGQVLTIPAGPAGPVAIPPGTDSALVVANGAPRAVLSLPPLNTAGQPAPTAATTGSLPASLFGRAASDPVRLAMLPAFHRWADHYGIDRNLLKGLAYVESSWRADAVSSAGAVGVGQLMPATSAWISEYLMAEPGLDPWRAEDNIRMSARYLRYLVDQLGVQDLAIGAYYQGIGSVQRDGMGAGTVQYVARVRAAQAAFANG